MNWIKEKCTSIITYYVHLPLIVLSYVKREVYEGAFTKIKNMQNLTVFYKLARPYFTSFLLKKKED